MARLVTHAEVSAVADGGALHLEPGDQLTPLAQERAQARGITIDSSGPGRPAGDDPAPEMVQEILRRVAAQLGDHNPAVNSAVAAEVLAAIGGAQRAPEGSGASFSDIDYCAGVFEARQKRARQRAVFTTTGRNHRGIVARLTAVIAEQGGDILDISQTLVGDYFTMIVVVDTAGLGGSFESFKGALEGAARDLELQALVMHEEIVTSLQRV